MSTQCIFPQIFVPLPSLDTTYMRYSLSTSSMPLSTSSISDNNISALFPSAKETQSDWYFPIPPSTPHSPRSPRSSSTNDIPSPKTTGSFPIFPAFVPEIRSLIWEFALPPARLVPIHYDPSTHFTSPARLPSILSVCKESRDAALRKYSLTFEASGSCPSTSKIYFNPTTDIFYIPPPSAPTSTPPNLAPFTHFTTTVTLLSRPPLLKVRRLAVHESVFLGVRGCWNNSVLVEDHLRWFWWQIFDKFCGVEEVTITGREETVLKEFGLEDEASEDDDDVDMDRDGDIEREILAFEETLYNIALKTYWDLRKQEPTWVPPRWRVWGVEEPRMRRGDRIVNGCGSVAL